MTLSSLSRSNCQKFIRGSIADGCGGQRNVIGSAVLSVPFPKRRIKTFKIKRSISAFIEDSHSCFVSITFTLWLSFCENEVFLSSDQWIFMKYVWTMLNTFWTINLWSYCLQSLTYPLTDFTTSTRWRQFSWMFRYLRTGNTEKINKSCFCCSRRRARVRRRPDKLYRSGKHSLLFLSLGNVHRFLFRC